MKFFLHQMLSKLNFRRRLNGVLRRGILRRLERDVLHLRLAVQQTVGGYDVTLDIDELREAESLLARMAAHAEKILPVLELMKSAGGQSILPKPVDRLIQRGDVMEMLKIGTAAVNQLIKAGKLTPLYVADSGNQKFRLSEVERVVSTIPPKPKVCNLRRHSA